LAQAIESDLKKIAGGQPRVFQIEFKLNNPDHQGADTCTASIRYHENDDFEVKIECLINHDSAKVMVRKRPRNAELEPIANILDKGEYTHLHKFEIKES
jgi:intracellular sulfur oxidation DsrE/DsrF family protein